jgi:hypothetical protein
LPVFSSKAAHPGGFFVSSFISTDPAAWTLHALSKGETSSVHALGSVAASFSLSHAPSPRAYTRVCLTGGHQPLTLALHKGLAPFALERAPFSLARPAAETLHANTWFDSM